MSRFLQDSYRIIIKNFYQEQYWRVQSRENQKCFDSVWSVIKKLHSIDVQLFIRTRKRNISSMFMTQSYFPRLKDVIINTTHFFIMKILNKQELQQIATKDSSEIDFSEFKRLCNMCIADPYWFLAFDCIFSSHNTLGFPNNLLEEVCRLFMTIDKKLEMKNYSTTLQSSSNDICSDQVR